MHISKTTANLLKKKGYGHLTIGQDVDMKTLNKEEIGVIMHSKNQSGDYIEKLIKVPMVLVEGGDSEQFRRLNERANDNYAMYDFSTTVPKTDAVGKDERLYEETPGEYGYDRDDSPLDMERGF